MSFFKTIGHDVVAFFKTNPVLAALKNGGEAALKELESLAENELQLVVMNTGVAVGTSLENGATVGAAVDAGVTAAKSALSAAGKTLSTQTVLTLVTSVHNQLNVAPAPAAS